VPQLSLGFAAGAFGGLLGALLAACIVIVRRNRDLARAEGEAAAARASLALALARENAANARNADLADALRAALRAEHARAAACPQDAAQARRDTPRHEPHYVAILHLHKPALLDTVRGPYRQN